MGLLLLILLLVLLVSAVPAWPHSREWGYGPSGVASLLLVILLVLLMFQVLPWGFTTTETTTGTPRIEVPAPVKVDVKVN